MADTREIIEIKFDSHHKLHNKQNVLKFVLLIFFLQILNLNCQLERKQLGSVYSSFRKFVALADSPLNRLTLVSTSAAYAVSNDTDTGL